MLKVLIHTHIHTCCVVHVYPYLSVRTMTTVHLSRKPPCESTLKSYAAARAVSVRPFNHGFMPGGTLQEERLRRIELQIRLGSGASCFRSSRNLLLAWDMHRGCSRSGIWTDNEGALVTWARLLPALWVINPCRTLSPLLSSHDKRAAAVGYATTRGHLIAGFERMEVRWHAGDDSVTFHIHSVSRGAGLLGRALFPWLAPAQRRFFEDQLRCMWEQVQCD